MLDLSLEYRHMKKEIDRALKDCLRHQKWILGPEVKKLEEKIAKYLGIDFCVGTSSGTESLVIALRALSLQRFNSEYFTREQKIITTPLTFTATGDAILRSGATPVFVDIAPETFNLDPQKIREYLRKNPDNIVGIVPVHLYGRACEMDQILAIAKEYKLFVIEDVAQAFGGTWKGKKLGSLGDLASFSFFPSKNLGGYGDGGMVAANDPGLAETVRMLTKHGGKDKNNVDHIGYNARLDTIQAAILLIKLKYINEFNKKRVAIAKMYQKELADCAELILPTIAPGHAFHQYTIRVLNNKRKQLQEHLAANGISTMIYYPVLLSKMPLFQKISEPAGTLASAEAASPEILSLPIEPLLQKREVLSICRCIHAGLG